MDILKRLLALRFRISAQSLAELLTKETARRLLALRFRISTQLFAAFGVAVALTVAASLIGMFSFNRVGNAQAAVNEGSLPEMEAAFGVAEYSTSLGAAAPRLVTASTPEEVDEIWKQIGAANELFRDHLGNLEDVDRESSQRIRIYSEALETYIETIRETKNVAFDLNKKSDALLEEMEDLEAKLEKGLLSAVDEKLFYILTGRTNLDTEAAAYTEHFSEAEFDTYRHLSALQTDTSIALQQLSSVFSIFDPALVEAQEERFESSIASIERNLASLNSEELEAILTPPL